MGGSAKSTEGWRTFRAGSALFLHLGQLPALGGGNASVCAGHRGGGTHRRNAAGGTYYGHRDTSPCPELSVSGGSSCRKARAEKGGEWHLYA